jgi:integrase
MARVRRHADLGSREARRRLPARSEPYWLVIDRGLSLGYRKSTEGGAWIVRRYDAGRRRHLEDRVGTADDYRDADGAEVLDFGHAQRKLLACAKHDAQRASGQLYTVADAITDYVDYMRTHRKTAADTESKLKAYVLPLLGTRRVAELTSADFEAWLTWALKRRRKPKKMRTDETSHGQKPIPSPEETTERQRRRKATLNRVINAFKACLNRANAAGKVPLRDAWARLKKFRAADSARLRWLTVDEATRIQNACAPEFRVLVRAALLSGCRMGELFAVRTGDFDQQSNTLLIPDSKSGKSRRVPLTKEGVALFEEITAGKAEDASPFARADGSPWYRIAVLRAMRAACVAGKITPPATFHTLRHTYASHLVQKKVPLLFVAAALGHADTRMVEKHYAHLAPSQVAALIRKNLPRFGTMKRSNVRSIRR